jgi:hypothetical protein
MSDLTAEKATALRKPFPPESVGKLPKGGAMLDYVGHAAVTDRLLTVDPEWSWEPLALDEVGLPALDRSGNLWIRLTICGVTRLGVGDGKNAKEAIGDAIRNAAMRFGVALDLWAKENLVEFEQAARTGGVTVLQHTPETPAQDAQEPPQTRRMSRPKAEPTDPLSAAQRAALHASLSEAGISDRDAKLAYCVRVIGREIESSNDLTRDEAGRILSAIKDGVPA